MELNLVKSKLQYVLYGVPQGFLLGPSPFSIYLNDFANNRVVYTRENNPRLTITDAYIRRERNHLDEYGLY